MLNSCSVWRFISIYLSMMNTYCLHAALRNVLKSGIQKCRSTPRIQVVLEEVSMPRFFADFSGVAIALDCRRCTQLWYISYDGRKILSIGDYCLESLSTSYGFPDTR